MDMASDASELTMDFSCQQNCIYSILLIRLYIAKLSILSILSFFLFDDVEIANHKTDANM